jgi:hypothetical protein
MPGLFWMSSRAWERLCGQVIQAVVTAVVLLTLPSPVRPALPYVLAGVGDERPPGRADVTRHPASIQEGKRPEPTVPSLAMDNDIDKEAIPAEPPVAGNELDTLLGELERVRGYIAWKCGGLNSAGLRATLGPSTMTLGGLLKHLSACEDHKFSIMLYGRAPHPP